MTQNDANATAASPEKAKTNANIDVLDFGDFEEVDNVETENTETIITERLVTSESLEKDLLHAVAEKINELDSSNEWISQPKNSGNLNFLGYALVTAITDFREAHNTKPITLENLLAEPQVTKHTNIQKALTVLQTVFKQKNLPKNSTGAVIQSNWNGYIEKIEKVVSENNAKKAEENVNEEAGKFMPMMKSSNTAAIVGATTAAAMNHRNASLTESLLAGAATASLVNGMENFDSSKGLKGFGGNIWEGVTTTGIDAMNAGAMGVDAVGDFWSSKENSIGKKVGYTAGGIGAIWLAPKIFRMATGLFTGTAKSLFSGEKETNEQGKIGTTMKLAIGAAVLFGLSKFIPKDLLDQFKGFSSGIEGVIPKPIKDKVVNTIQSNELAQKGQLETGMGVNDMNIEKTAAISIKENLNTLKNKHPQNQNLKNHIHNMIVKIETNEKDTLDSMLLESLDFRILADIAEQSNIPNSHTFNTKNKTFSLIVDGISFDNIPKNPHAEIPEKRTQEEIDNARVTVIEEGLQQLESQADLQFKEKDTAKLKTTIANIQSSVSAKGFSGFTTDDLENIDREISELGGFISFGDEKNVTLLATFPNGEEIVLGVNPNSSQEEFIEEEENIGDGYYEAGIEGYEKSFRGITKRISDHLEETLKTGNFNESDTKKLTELIQNIRSNNEFFDSPQSITKILYDFHEINNKNIGASLWEDGKFVLYIAGVAIPLQLVEETWKTVTGEIGADSSGFKNAAMISTITVGGLSEVVNRYGAHQFAKDEKGTLVKRKVIGSSLKRITAIPRWAFFRIPLAPWILAKKGIQKNLSPIANINNGGVRTPLRAIKTPKALYRHKWANNQTTRSVIKSHRPFQKDITKHERKAFRLYEQYVRLERTKQFTVKNDGSTPKMGLEQKKKNIQVLQKELQIKFEAVQEDIPESNRLKTITIENDAIKDPRVQKVRNDLKIAGGSTEDPSKKQPKPAEANISSQEPLSDKQKKAKTLDDQIRKEKKKLAKLEQVKLRGSSAENNSAIERSKEKIKNLQLERKITYIVEDNAKVFAQERNLNKGETRSLVKGLKTLAKVAGISSALYGLATIAQSENPRAAVVESVGFGLIIGAGSLAGPIGIGLSLIGTAIWGAEFSNFFTEIEKDIQKEMDEKGLSKEYFMSGEYIQKYMGGDMGWLEKKWDTLEISGKGNSAYNYFSEEKSNSIAPAFAKVITPRLLDSILYTEGKSLFRTKENIQDWDNDILEKIDDKLSYVTNIDKTIAEYSAQEKEQAEKEYNTWENKSVEEQDSIVQNIRMFPSHKGFPKFYYFIMRNNRIKEIKTLSQQLLYTFEDNKTSQKDIYKFVTELHSDERTQKNKKWISDHSRILNENLSILIDRKSEKSIYGKTHYYDVLKKTFIQIETYKNMGFLQDISNTDLENVNTSNKDLLELFKDLPFIKNPETLPKSIQDRAKRFSQIEAQIEVISEKV